MTHRLYEKDVENATNCYGSEPDWGKVVEMCGRIQNSVGSTALKGALVAVMMRVKHPEERIKLQALSLLESCVTNCGKSFRAEMADQQILNDIRDVVKGVGCSTTVSNRMKMLLASWSVEFANETSFSPVCQLKTSLQSQGISFPTARASTTTTARTTPSQHQEDDDLKRAIELSLQEQSRKTQSSSSSSMYPSLNAPTPTIKNPSKPTGKKCRALFDFTAAEDNELSFKTGEVIEILDDRDKHWWKGRSAIGEGLFPSNFVTLDLSTDPSAKRSEDIKKTKERARLASASSKPKQINMEVIDVCLDMLRNADTTSTNREENTTLKEMEAQCKAMRPLVEKKIIDIEREEAQLQQLNEEYQQAIIVYRQLLSSGVVSQQSHPLTSVGGQMFTGPSSGPNPHSADMHVMGPQSIYQQQQLGQPPVIQGQGYVFQQPIADQSSGGNPLMAHSFTQHSNQTYY